MPTTIFLKGGVRFTLKGDGPGTVIKRLFNPMATGIAMNNRIIEFRKREVIFIDPEPEAEYQAELAKAAKQKADEERAQAEAREKAEEKKDAQLEKAAEAFILKYGPDKAQWPETLRPKAPASSAASEN